MMAGINTGLQEAVDKAAALDLSAQADFPDQADLSQSLEEQKLWHELNVLKQQLLQSVDNHNLRLKYADKVFWLVCVWLSFVIMALGCSGLHIHGFQLSDNVLIAFIVSTTASVIGLFAIVAKWLFPSRGK